MRITYVANIRMPTEKAHGAQIIKTCEAFARLPAQSGTGQEVELIVPARSNTIHADPFSYYGVEKKFTVTRVPVFDTVSWGKIGFLLETFSFARTALRRLRAAKGDVVYGRDEWVLAFLLFFGGRRIVWESHTGAWNWAARYVTRHADGVVAITQRLADFYHARGVPAQKLLVAHDGVSVDDFAHPESKDAARTRLGLPLDKKIALYIGRLDGWKGTDTLCKAAALLPSGQVVVLIGGEPRQIEEIKKRYPRVHCVGYRPYAELADNQMAGDVLVLPNTGKDIVSVQFTSPLKLFSYMASGIPIVASDLPSIREVLSEREAYLVTPDDPVALAAGLQQALADADAPQKAAAARVAARSYDWQARAHKIFAFILAQKA